MIKHCNKHGDVEFKPTGRGDNQRMRCLKCNVERVTKRRRLVKQKLVEEFGGKCSICGYNKCLAALDFHHLDPTIKSFGISCKGLTRSFESTLVEAKKCQLICKNCHAELHNSG